MFGIDMGPSSGEKSQYGALTSASGFATGVGESDLDASSKFMQGILSGDSSKISAVLAPQISAAKKSAEETNKTTAEMGTRSGGTGASTAATNDKVHSDITNAVAGLTGNAATSLSTTGSGLLSAGMAGDEAGFAESKTMQDQNAAKWTDIIQSISKTAGTVAGIPGVSGTPFGTGLNSVNAQFGG